jgi:hypothetical protein
MQKQSHPGLFLLPQSPIKFFKFLPKYPTNISAGFKEVSNSISYPLNSSLSTAKKYRPKIQVGCYSTAKKKS